MRFMKKSSKSSNIIGVLGGMGPQASAAFYKLLVEKSVKDYGARKNCDYPEILIDSIPVPDFISNTKQIENAKEILKDRVKRMDTFGVNTICIACNTAHILTDELQKITKVSFISMIGEVARKASTDQIQKVGILGTPSTLKFALYQKELKKYGIKSFVPTKKQINLLGKIIQNIIGGKIKRSEKKTLISIANELKERGAEAIILGCTELPLIFPTHYSLPVYSSSEILAISLLHKYYQKNTIRR